MADITLSYKGSTIKEISASGTTTLNTAGTYCEDDITLEYTQPSGGDSQEDAIIARTISGAYTNSTVTTVGYYAFYDCRALTTASFPACTTISLAAFSNCSALTTVSFPMCTTIDAYAFYGCNALTTASFPMCTSIGGNAFYSCRALTTASFPACTTIGAYAFRGCNALTTASFPMCTSIGGSVFSGCFRLVSLYLTGSVVASLTNSRAFYSTPIGGYSASAGQYGSVYVPWSLLASYKAATNWTYFSSRIVGI